MFYTQIQEDFSDLPPGLDPTNKCTDAVPAIDCSVDIGDVLVNDADIDGRVLNTTNLSPQVCAPDTENPDGECREADDTGTSVSSEFGNLSKLIYAVDGVIAPDPDTGFPDDPLVASDGPQLLPAQVITYQISYNLSDTDFENLRLTDYLPLPVLDAAELDFDPRKPRCSDWTTSPNPPPAGTVCFKTAALSTGTEDTVDTFLDYATSRDYDVTYDFNDFSSHGDPSNSVQARFW